MAESKGLYSVQLSDIVKGAVMFAVTNLVTGLIQLLSDGEFPTWTEFKPVLITTVTAFLVYVFKNYLTNSQGQVMVKESPAQIAIVQQAKEDVAIVKQEEKDAKKP